MRAAAPRVVVLPGAGRGGEHDQEVTTGGQLRDGGLLVDAQAGHQLRVERGGGDLADVLALAGGSHVQYRRFGLQHFAAGEPGIGGAGGDTDCGRTQAHRRPDGRRCCR